MGRDNMIGDVVRPVADMREKDKTDDGETKSVEGMPDGLWVREAAGERTPKTPSSGSTGW